MGRPVIIITDSAADVPPDLVEELGIRVLPLTLHFGPETYRDGVDITNQEFFRRLRESTLLPTTSQGTPGQFAALYQEALDAGYDVLVVVLGGKISGTVDAARLAAGPWGPARIRVVDSNQVSLACGWLAIVGARAARAGATLDEVEAVVRDRVPLARLYAVFDTLEYLHRGGRIGRASVLMGTLFQIKPLITLEDGEVTPVARPRTWGKALEKMVELITAAAPLEELAVVHADAPARARQLVDMLSTHWPQTTIRVCEVGAVLGTHTGPGTVGACFLRAR